MSIHLIIKGNIAQAHEAAELREISLTSIYSNVRNKNETNARCPSDYRQRVVAWFAELPRQSPYPVGTLLLFTENKESK